MRKTNEAAVEWLIETVKTALEDGSASEADLEEWLLAAILLEEMALEEMALEEEAQSHEAPGFASSIQPTKTLH